METYITTDWEKEAFVEEYPILACPNSIGILYGDFFSCKCKVLAGNCTYKNSNKKEYLNCKILQNNSK